MELTTTKTGRMARLEVEGNESYETPLYRFTGEFAAAIHALDSLEAREDLTGEQKCIEADAIMAQLAELQEELPVKMERCAAYSKALKGQAATIKAEESRLAERRRAIEARDERFRGYMLRCLEQCGGRIRWATGGARVQISRESVVEVGDEQFIPREFWKPQPPTLDKIGIKAALKEGRAVGEARLVDGRPSLRID